jgi:hypothetical protein
MQTLSADARDNPHRPHVFRLALLVLYVRIWKFPTSILTGNQLAMGGTIGSEEEMLGRSQMTAFAEDFAESLVR